MAKDSVGCGHGLTGQMALWPELEAPVRIERAKKAGLCPDKAAGQQTEREQESPQARAAHAAAGLPALTGTPKQVAWAATIRAKALASPPNQVPRCATDSDTGRLAAKAATGELGLDELVARNEPALEVAAAARRELEMQTSARWWIDRRDQVDGHVHRAHAAAARHASPDLRACPDAGKEATAEVKRLLESLLAQLADLCPAGQAKLGRPGQQAVQAAVADPAAAADLAVAQLQVIAEPQHFLHLPHRDPRSRHAVPSPPEGQGYLP